MEIWKFDLGSNLGERLIEMPSGSVLMSVQLQRDQPVLWALCDRKRQKTLRRIWAYATGDALLRSWPYLGTVQAEDWVSHYFDHGEVAKSA